MSSYLRSRVSPTVDTSVFTSNASYFTRKADFGKSLYLVRFSLLFCGEFFRLVVGAMASFHLLPLVSCTAFKLYISMTRAKIIKSSPHHLISHHRQSIAVLTKGRYAQCPVWPMPCLANAQCPVVPHLSEKGYRCTKP